MLLSLFPLLLSIAAQAPPAQSSRPARPPIQIDETRARELYVSKDPKDHAPGHDFDRDIRNKAEIDRRYADLRLGLVDASLVALAEQLGVRRIATRDVRDFAAVRLQDGTTFELVVHPTNPDRS